MQWQWIDADDARLMLMGNKNNRRVSPMIVKRYAGEILAGRWDENNPQPIVLGPGDRLMDGQHRLMALVAAAEQNPDVRIRVLIVNDIPESVFDVIDQGQPRSASQTLHTIHGISSATSVAAAASFVIRYERVPHLVWSGGLTPAKSEVIAFVLKHQDQATLLDVGSRWRQARVVASTAAALQWLVIRHSRSPEAWEDFSTGVIEGAGLSTGDPRLTLRNRGPSVADRWGTGQGRLAIYLKAWNAYVEGREVRLLRFTRAELPMPTVS